VNGLAIFIAYFFSLGNLIVNPRPIKQGTIVKSKLLSKPKNGIFNLALIVKT
jgi:hypothetical protein